MKQVKRKFAYLFVVILILSLLAGCGNQEADEEGQPEPQKTIKAGMVTDVGGLGDQSFNDAAHRGLKKAEDELGAEINVIESNLPSDYVPNLSSMAEQGFDMVWAIGVLMTDAVIEAADQYPDTKFGIIDAVVEKPNVASITFKEEDGSYLMGIISGEMTEKNKVGFVGGMEIPLIKKFEAGFRAGFKEVNPDGEVLVGYTGAFDDPGAGKELATTQFDQGADIIYHASGACGVGVINAAKELGEDYYAIGVDSPQAHLAPDSVITSMVKAVDFAVYDTIEKMANNNFEAKHYVLGLEEDAVIPSEHLEEMAPESVIEKVNEYKEKIISGEIKVPESPEELNQ
ncbi:MAG: BMP family lipoprotein [Halanaerobiales bacterium]